MLQADAALPCGIAAAHSLTTDSPLSPFAKQRTARGRVRAGGMAACCSGAGAGRQMLARWWAEMIMLAVWLCTASGVYLKLLQPPQPLPVLRCCRERA